MKAILGDLGVYFKCASTHPGLPRSPWSRCCSVNTGIGPWSGAHHEPSVSHLPWWQHQHRPLIGRSRSRDLTTGLWLADGVTHIMMMTPGCLTWADTEEPRPVQSNLQSHHETFWLWWASGGAVQVRVSCVWLMDTQSWLSSSKRGQEPGVNIPSGMRTSRKYIPSFLHCLVMASFYPSNEFKIS